MSETRVSTLSTLIQHSFGIHSQINKTRRRNKRNSNRKGKSQIPYLQMILFEDDLIPKRALLSPPQKKLHLKTPRHHKQLQQSSRIQNQYTKKSIAYLYANNEQTEKEFRKTILLTIASKVHRNKLKKSERALQ
jgi:hypothetical protein